MVYANHLLSASECLAAVQFAYNLDEHLPLRQSNEHVSAVAAELAQGD